MHGEVKILEITIKLCESTSKQLEQYLSQKNIQCANLADEFERDGNILVADALRTPVTTEDFVAGLVLRALDERR